MPDGGPPPPIIPLDTEALFTDCNCGPTVNEALAPFAGTAISPPGARYRGRGCHTG